MTAASLMFACQLTFFVQMACLIVFTIALSISLALGLYVPFTVIGRAGNRATCGFSGGGYPPKEKAAASEKRAASWRLDPVRRRGRRGARALQAPGKCGLSAVRGRGSLTACS